MKDLSEDIADYRGILVRIFMLNGVPSWGLYSTALLNGFLWSQLIMSI